MSGPSFSQANPSVKVARTQQLIGGEWVDAADGRTIAVECPANRQTIAHTPRSSEVDVDRAVMAAAKAFESWKNVLPSERGRLLYKIADALEPRIEELARLVAHETGNAIRTQARPEATMTVEGIRYFAGLGSELKGETLPYGDGILSYTRREPLGVIAAIIPWNAPVSIAANKIAPALIAGNTLVLKVAEDAPLGVLLLAEICNEILPPGVVNVITGYGAEAGAALVAHPMINKVSFTGSSAVGKNVLVNVAERVLPVSLELGGKSPAIVFEDANEDWAVEGAAGAMRFTRQSQSCTAGSRLFLHESIYESFVDKLATRVEKYVIGDPLSEESDMGTLISGKQFKTVTGYIEDGLAQEDVLLKVGGMPPTDGPLSEGYYTKPTIFTSTSNTWRLAREEIFGPVLVAIPFSDEDEVVRMANQSHYGLAGYVFSKDATRAIRVAHKIDSGWIQVNQGKGQLFGQPYGGFKTSGLGKESSLGSVLESFSRLKTVTVNLDM
jgi:betaine-aldehyde dehydrogenase